ncbi:MAG: hypothetical protein GY870_12125, partial [archaeon]|nr:hypothetical protein [archaeon]
MATNMFPVIIVAILFILVMIICTRENLDTEAFALIIAVIAACITTFYFSSEISALGTESGNGDVFKVFLGFIDFELLFFLICMQIVVAIAEKHNIFQWMVLKALHFTKGDHRKFFFMICTISSFSAAIISDITVAIIFIPLVIRACKILRINAAPYMFGISFTINIGSIYTPFSSSENILISQKMGLDFFWFLQNFTLFVLVVLFATLIVLDIFFLRKIPPPEERDKKILLEIMNPEIVIIDKKKFIINTIGFILVIMGFIFFSQAATVVAIIGAVSMCIINKEYFTDILLKVDWKVITFFVALFTLFGSMEINGTFGIIGDLASSIISENPLIAAITVLLLISVLSGFLAQIPTALVFMALLEEIYTLELVPPLIIVAMLLGINIGSNFLPQGAA